MGSSSTQHQTSPIIALIGNLGAGKSTTSNGLVGRHIFRSGITEKSGITKTLDFYQSDTSPVSVCDTPGLLDIRDTRTAAIKHDTSAVVKELDILLSKRRDIFILFVVNLDDGRPREKDAVMIHLVLSAIGGDLTNRFGVIVNKVSKDIMWKLETNENNVAMNMREKLTGTYRTSQWLYVQYSEKLCGKRNRMLKCDQLNEFLFAMYDHGTKPTKEKGKRVKPIDVRGMEKKGKEYRARCRRVEGRSSKETQHAERKFKEEVRRYKEECERAKADAERIMKDVAEILLKLMEEFKKRDVDLLEYMAKKEKKAPGHGLWQKILPKIWGAVEVAGGAGAFVVGALSSDPLAILGGASTLVRGVSDIAKDMNTP